MNKFQKAVQKRNAELENIENETNNVIDDKSEMNTVEKIEMRKIIKPEVENEQDSNISININNLFIHKDKKAKNKTFYLEEDVISAIEKQSKKQKVSDSKFLNEILKHIFKL